MKVNPGNVTCLYRLISVLVWDRRDPQVPAFSQGETQKVAEWEASSWMGGKQAYFKPVVGWHRLNLSPDLHWPAWDRAGDVRVLHICCNWGEADSVKNHRGLTKLGKAWSHILQAVAYRIRGWQDAQRMKPEDMAFPDAIMPLHISGHQFKEKTKGRNKTAIFQKFKHYVKIL